MAFDALLPHAASDVDARIRVVRIAPKTPNQPLGFAVRGGFEHGIGFYVSEVEKDSVVRKKEMALFVCLLVVLLGAIMCYSLSSAQLLLEAI